MAPSLMSTQVQEKEDLKQQIDAVRQQLQGVFAEKRFRQELNLAKYFIPDGKQEAFIKLSSFIRMFMRQRKEAPQTKSCQHCLARVELKEECLTEI